MGISRAYVFLLLKPLFSLNELPIAKANILIDDTGNACLVDFGLLKILPDPATFLFSTSNVICGSTRWMSPELIDPLKFGFEKSRLTKFSDCYALGMVIYETVSGRMPFHKYSNYLVSLKVVNGERPPRGVSFPDSLWKMLELCWASQQDDRPNVEDVLQCLESSSQVGCRNGERFRFGLIRLFFAFSKQNERRNRKRMDTWVFAVCSRCYLCSLTTFWIAQICQNNPGNNFLQRPLLLTLRGSSANVGTIQLRRDLC